jgi:hypothetical protein
MGIECGDDRRIAQAVDGVLSQREVAEAKVQLRATWAPSVFTELTAGLALFTFAL